MNLTLERLRDASSMTEAQTAFGEFLGLDDPVPEAVIRHAFADQYYRHNLILNRNRPEVLRHLFQHPRNAAFEQEGDGRSERAAAHAGPSNAQLVAKAGKALFEWAKSGFAVVEQEVFDARFGACERCDKLVAPPGKLIYALTRTKRSDPRVCGACGCTAARKAKLASESCPLPDPANPALTRWGEPVRTAAGEEQ